MGRKRRGNSRWELLPYPGLGFVLHGAPTPARSRGSWIPFVRPVAYVSPFIIEERPQEEVAGIDTPLPSRTREEEGGLCSDVPLQCSLRKATINPNPRRSCHHLKAHSRMCRRRSKYPSGRMACQESGAPIISQPITTWMTAGKSTTPRYGRKMENATPAVSSGTSAGIAPSHGTPEGQSTEGYSTARKVRQDLRRRFDSDQRRNNRTATLGRSRHYLK